MDSRQEIIQETPSSPVVFLECFIHTLPFDVIHDIFLLVSYVEEISTAKSIVLSQVCRRWREYALDIPILWSVLEFTRDGVREEWYKQKEFLKRSKEAPLDIKITSFRRSDMLYASALKQVLKILVPHIHRWRSLRVYLHIKLLKLMSDRLHRAAAPALETLTIGMWNENAMLTKWRCRMFGGGLPKLRKWHTRIELLPPLYIVNGIDGLRDLQVSDSPWSDCGLRYPMPKDLLKILSRHSNLERLKLILDNYENLGPTHPDPVTLPNLISLHIGSQSGPRRPTPFLLQIVSNIRAPCIRSLESLSLCNSFIPAIGSFNPFPGLQKLMLRYYMVDPIAGELSLMSYERSVLGKAFKNLSFLNTLFFLAQILPDGVFEILHNCCPHLTHLALDQCSFMEYALIDLVKARMASQSVSSLQRLEITGSPSSYPSPQDLLWLRETLPEFFTDRL